MTDRSLAAAAVLAALVTGCASRPATPPPTPSAPVVAAPVPDRAIVCGLPIMDRRLQAVRSNGTPLSAALVAFTEDTGLTVEPRWGPLAACGVSRDAVVTFDAKNVKLSRVLTELLQRATPAGGTSRPDWVFVEASEAGPARVALTSAADVGATLTEWRAYDVGDMLDVPPGREWAARRAESMQDVAVLVAESVAPASWTAAGGAYGDVRVEGERLVVRQTSQNHGEVAKLFADLREQRGPRSAPAPPTTRGR